MIASHVVYVDFFFLSVILYVNCREISEDLIRLLSMELHLTGFDVRWILSCAQRESIHSKRIALRGILWAHENGMFLPILCLYVFVYVFAFLIGSFKLITNDFLLDKHKK